MEEGEGALSRLVADVGAGTPTGNFWSYTNAGWCVLGRVIEAVTDTAWEESMRQHLLDWAGMHETAFAFGAGAQPRVSGHEITLNGPVPVEPLVARAYGPAGTSIVSTVTDLLRFAAMHLDHRPLAPLRAVHAEVSIHGWLDSWCLGWAHFDWADGQVWGWDGLVNGERSLLRIIPEHRGAVVLMRNSDTGRAMYRSLFADLMEPLFGINVPPLRLEGSPGAAGVDAAGRPRVLYLMLWGLPRIDA